MDTISIVVGLLAGIIVGGAIVFTVVNWLTTKKRDQIINDAEAQAETIMKDKMVKAKERFLQLKEEHEKFIGERNRKVQSAEDRIKHKEVQLSQQLEGSKRKEKEVDAIRDNLDKQLDIVDKKKKELDKLHQKQVEELERISAYSAADAKKELVEVLKNEAKTEALSMIKDITDEAKLTANSEARKIVVKSIQRVATEQAIENSVSVFNIESDEIKGRIIGREGRNIRALESATGVEIIVDDTPEAIILSCFDPVRREIARLSLHQLVSDGRIHPARIEEVVKKTEKNIADEIVEIGKRTTIDLGIHGLHPELIRMVGRMKYRSSYGQNLLQHSREVANLCATMASELGPECKTGQARRFTS